MQISLDEKEGEPQWIMLPLATTPNNASSDIVLGYQLLLTRNSTITSSLEAAKNIPASPENTFQKQDHYPLSPPRRKVQEDTLLLTYGRSLQVTCSLARPLLDNHSFGSRPHCAVPGTEVGSHLHTPHYYWPAKLCNSSPTWTLATTTT